MADVGATILGATQGFSAFTQFLPRLSEVRRTDPGSDIAADVRMGEIAAAGVTIGTGAILASLTKSNTPIIVAVIVTLGFILLYESVLRSNASAPSVITEIVPVTRTEYPELS